MSEIFLGKQGGPTGILVAVKKIRWKNMSSIEAKLREQIHRFRKWRNKRYEAYIEIPKIDKNDIENEILMLQAAEHKYVVKYYQWLTKGIFSYIVTELCAFCIADLYDSGSDIPTIPYDLSLFLATPILEALSYIHSKQIAHMDVKPGNILIDTNGVPKLCDFGVATKINKEVQASIVGTLGFIAPELYLGKQHPFDTKADMFSFGSTIVNLINRGHFRFNNFDSAKDFFTDELVKFKNDSEKQNFFLQFQYGIQGEKNNKEFNNCCKLARLFVLYNPEKRLSAKDALENTELSLYKLAWENQGKLYRKCRALFEKRMSDKRLSLKPLQA